jgi:hypothetical protein
MSDPKDLVEMRQRIARILHALDTLPIEELCERFAASTIETPDLEKVSDPVEQLEQITDSLKLTHADLTATIHESMKSDRFE